MNRGGTRENLQPFNTLPPERQRDIARLGGIASGEKRREIADAKYSCLLAIAAHNLVNETREEYRRAIRRYVKEENRKAKRREMSKNVTKSNT